MLRTLDEYSHRYQERPEDDRRHVFHLAAPEGAPERWEHLAEHAYWFVYEWVPLRVAAVLAASQADPLHLLAAPAP